MDLSNVSEATVNLDDTLNKSVNLDVTVERNFEDVLKTPKPKNLEIKLAEDYFNQVGGMWGLTSKPDPHKDLTVRFVNEPIKKPSNSHQKESRNQIHVGAYYDNKISELRNKIDALDRDSKDFSEQFCSIRDEIDKIHEEKDNTLAINKFYNAQYLSDDQHEDVIDQSQILEKIKDFYKS